MLPSETQCVDALARATGFHLDMVEESARTLSRIWVARRDASSAEPDAFLLVWVAADELHVIAIGTRPEARREGLARALVETLVDYAKETRARLILLEVRRSNRAAARLYRSFGFSIARLRRGYYAAPEEDGIEMLVTLNEHGQLERLPDEVKVLEV
jgi:ribosomal-protein-alanine N-acetyltransferase